MRSRCGSAAIRTPRWSCSRCSSRALLANARAHVDGDAFFAPIAGLLLGLLLFLRFDAVLGVAGIAAGLCLTVIAGGRLRWSFVVTLLAALLLAAVYMLGPMRAYAYLPIVFLSNLPWWQDAALVLVAGLAIGALGVGSRSRRSQSHRRRAMRRRSLRLWSVPPRCMRSYLRQPGGKLTDYDAFALRTYAYLYMTVPAVLAALFGYALVARQRFWRDPALFVTVAIFAVFFFYKIRIVPEQFWMARRFVPIILPATLLFACGAALAGMQSGSRRTRLLRGSLGFVFLTLLGLHYARVAQPAARPRRVCGDHPEDRTDRRHDSRRRPPDRRIARRLGHPRARPAAGLHLRPATCCCSRSRVPDKSAFASFLDWAHTRYARVLFMGGGGTELLSPRWDVRPIAGERFQVPEYEVATTTYPPDGAPEGVRLQPVHVRAAADASGDAGPFALDVGTEDDLHVLRFHAKETANGRSYRWSRDVSYISLPSLPAGSREVTFWMDDGGRPRAAPPADVSISLQLGFEAGKPPSVDRLLGTVRVGPGFDAYTVAIPPDLSETAASAHQPVRLKLATPVWNPQQLLGSGDDRDLGVMVDRAGGKMTAAMAALHIADPRERRLVAAADRLLWLAAAPRKWWRPSDAPASPHRILLLRLERIGDLLMVLPAIADLRALLPGATIDLVVGSWNRSAGRDDPRRVAGRDAGRRVAGARTWRRGHARADPACADLAAASVRPRDQLRAGHPQQPAARGLRRGVHDRLRQRRRRCGARSRARLRPARAHDRQCAPADRQRHQSRLARS